ncbi:hypothetical protein CHUAL_011280 [Chamberlinius hualienensis]
MVDLMFGNILCHFKRNFDAFLWIYFIFVNIHSTDCAATALGDFVMLNNQKVRLTTQECKNFSAYPGSEIYSPNYPHAYPKNVDCKKVIEAPQGNLIRLEFREKFKVEKSHNCENDYLEIRDGRHPFSKLVGNFCGNAFPADITSTDRYLYLHFKTDDSIEMLGFKITYSFKDKSGTGSFPHNCEFPLSGIEGTFGSHMIPEENRAYALNYKVSINCLWNIEVEPNKRIFLNITSFTLAKPNDCDRNFIEIFVQSEEKTKNEADKSNREASVSLVKFCGSITDPEFSIGNRMTVLYYEDYEVLNSNKSSHFEVLYTTFRKLEQGEYCDPVTEFDCQDTTCIASSLKCNRKNNCKYSTDEEDCDIIIASMFDSLQVKIILIFGLAILISIMIPSCLNFYKKLKNSSDSESVADPSSVRESIGQRTVEGSIAETNNLASVNGITNIGTDDDDGCYVPEVDLSIFLKRSNGGHSISMQDSPPVSGEETPLDSTLPTNFDSADPLIMTTPTSSNSNGPPFLVHVAPLVPQILHKKNGNYYRSSNYNDQPRTSTPPPPPPPPMVYYNNGLDSFDSINNSCYTTESDNNNSMFMPPPPTLEEVEESDAIFGLPALSTGIPNDGHGRAGNSRRLNDPRNRFKAEATVEDVNRSRSFESTKSAPDVIGRI